MPVTTKSVHFSTSTLKAKWKTVRGMIEDSAGMVLCADIDMCDVCSVWITWLDSALMDLTANRCSALTFYTCLHHINTFISSNCFWFLVKILGIFKNVSFKIVWLRVEHWLKLICIPFIVHDLSCRLLQTTLLKTLWLTSQRVLSCVISVENLVTKPCFAPSLLASTRCSGYDLTTRSISNHLSPSSTTTTILVLE